MPAVHLAASDRLLNLGVFFAVREARWVLRCGGRAALTTCLLLELGTGRAAWP